MRPNVNLCAALFLVSLMHLQAAGEEHWARFRGPNGMGVCEDTRVPASWKPADYRWTTDLPGRGHSSPVVWGSRVFVTSADSGRKERYLLCVDAGSGQEIWRQTYPYAVARFKTHKNNSLASSTPVVDADSVYVLLQSPADSQLIALSHEGKQRWRVELGPYRHGQGPAVSLIAHAGRVYLSNDHKQGSFLGAFDCRTGESVWRVEREGKRACYATPCIRRAEGGDEIVFSHCFEGVIGVDAGSGEVRWKADPFGRASQRAIGSPLVLGDLVIASSGVCAGEKNVVALAVSAGDKEAREVYRVSKSAAPHVPTPLIHNDRLYLWADIGIVTCLELNTGKRIWQKRVGGNDFGSPILVGDRIVCVDVDGVAVVIEAGDVYKEIGRTTLGQASHATPAVANGVIYFRTESRLFALAGESKE